MTRFARIIVLVGQLVGVLECCALSAEGVPACFCHPVQPSASCRPEDVETFVYACDLAMTMSRLRDDTLRQSQWSVVTHTWSHQEAVLLFRCCCCCCCSSSRSNSSCCCCGCVVVVVENLCFEEVYVHATHVPGMQLCCAHNFLTKKRTTVNL